MVLIAKTSVAGLPNALNQKGITHKKNKNKDTTTYQVAYVKHKS